MNGAHEAKLAELEMAIEAEMASASLDTKGCFGTLLFKEGDAICDICEHFKDCKAELEATREKQMADAEVELEKIGARFELDDEYLKLQELKAKPADPEPVEPEPTEPEPVTASQVDVSKLAIKSRAVSLDWNKVVGEIVEKKPDLYKGVAKAVRGHMAKEYTASAYAYTNKILEGLKAQGAIDWSGDKKALIEWKV
jgi:hypothetical protein